MTEAEARARFAASPVARLATATPDGRPHLVPIVFILRDGTIYHGVDAKPKRGTALRRLANLDANPHASVLVDHYDDDWDALWWVRADGTARDVDPAGPEGRAAVRLLAARYPRYRLLGRLIAIDVTGWSWWTA
ncbi:TIGR03668 family PPOX class F420-dependent oxidoreductase [Dactylosporangium siamense]|uniref:PPOX class F420-dependent oxidoreductase n=1 Tax=Dactylosporangium siamense TaxID=685454 RepID=A0A919PSF3_9ACTN|nr:TIGR03668 family PPOX class F420-dependent oxidoreductase [Dactylosporangium siamense]GIG50040.1 PPOX class F420-dependent oxidoreductase [Dactylosporangium siamense]